jgi:hypothetical protein
VEVKASVSSGAIQPLRLVQCLEGHHDGIIEVGLLLKNSKDLLDNLVKIDHLDRAKTILAFTEVRADCQFSSLTPELSDVQPKLNLVGMIAEFFRRTVNDPLLNAEIIEHQVAAVMFTLRRI